MRLIQKKGVFSGIYGPKICECSGLQEALNAMDSLDREVLTLRHFEQLSNSETALVLGVTESAACNRYVRALKRLKKLLEGQIDEGGNVW